MGADRTGDETGALLDLARACRLSSDQARAVVREVCGAVARWRAIPASHGIDPDEQERFAGLFEDRPLALESIAA